MGNAHTFIHTGKEESTHIERRRHIRVNTEKDTERRKTYRDIRIERRKKKEVGERHRYEYTEKKAYRNRIYTGFDTGEREEKSCNIQVQT